jgi:Protein of unknown function (DUF4197)
MKFNRLVVLASLAAAATLPAAAQSFLDVGKSLLQNQVQEQMAAPHGSTLGAALPTSDISAGLKEALKTATDRVTSQLGRPDGYNADSKIHIPLPDTLRTAQTALRMAGASGLADDLETKLNRAAEAAAPKAKTIFVDAVQKMTLDDARGILNGPQDAATQYFKRTMSPDLKTAMRPVVDSTVANAGAVQAYNSMTSGVPGIAGIPDPKSMLSDYVLGHALDGIFTYLAGEEAAIRTNPAKQSTDLLRKVFGG